MIYDTPNKLKISWRRGKQYTSPVTLGGRHNKKSEQLKTRQDSVLLGVRCREMRANFCLKSSIGKKPMNIATHCFLYTKAIQGVQNASSPRGIISRAVTCAYFSFECVDFYLLWIRLIFYIYFTEIFVQMNNYLKSEDDCFWTLDTISFAQRFQ